MSKLFFDYETRSVLDLTTCGLDRYVRHPSTRVILCAFAFDDGPVELWEPHAGDMPGALRDGLLDPLVVKVSWNARFEREISRACLNLTIPFDEFLDVMIWTRHLSIPFGLEKSCEIMGLAEDERKLEVGKKLIQLFSIPADMGGEETLFGITEPSFHDHISRPQEWEQFKAYCVQDVVAERAILKKIEKFPLPDQEQRGWILDQEINSRGMPVDLKLVSGATAVAETAKSYMRAELKQLTGVENTNSVPQMMAWLRSHQYPFSGLAKGFVERVLNGEGNVPEIVRTALTLRKQTSKTSDSKLDRIREMVGPDARLRDQFSYLGSSRAGRWSSRGGVQLHNLPRPTKAVSKKLDRAIELLTAGDYNAVVKEFENPLEVVASCIRSTFKAPPGYRFEICDLNAIENRMLGWIAQCDAILKVFRDKRCPYLDFSMKLYAQAQAEYGVLDYDHLAWLYAEGDEQVKQWRQDSKPPILGAGYRLGPGQQMEDEQGNIIFTGLLGYSKNMGIELTPEQAAEGIRIFRQSFPEVKNLWYDLERAVFKAIRENEIVECARCQIQAFGPKSDRKLLRILLPSGRGLHYIRPKIEPVVFMGEPKPTMVYEGIDLKKHTWTRIPTQGGKILENCDQAMSRDILLEGMFRAEARGLSIVGHCHDEIIALVPADSPLTHHDLREAMIEPPAWGPDIPLEAEGFSSDVYKKG